MTPLKIIKAVETDANGNSFNMTVVPNASVTKLNRTQDGLVGDQAAQHINGAAVNIAVTVKLPSGIA